MTGKARGKEEEKDLIVICHCLAFSPICHSRSYNSLIDFMFELDWYFLVTDYSSYFSPFVPC